MRIFGYSRVSTLEQNTENQRLELVEAGYEILPRRWFSDQVSGSIRAMDRPQFKLLADRIESGDMLVVSKLDRLGRDMIDVLSTIKMLSDMEIKLKVKALGETDLTSPAGKMLVSVLAAAAELERDLIVERTQAGLRRAKSEGKTLGRRPKVSSAQKEKILELLSGGKSVSEVARNYGVSRASVISYRNNSDSIKMEA